MNQIEFLQHSRIVVTLDSDFHFLLVLTNVARPSVIRIRIESLRAQPLVGLLEKTLSEWNAELENGVMLTVQSGQIRMHHLPIVSNQFQ